MQWSDILERVIKQEPLHIQVYHILKSQILRAKYPPGSKIIESKLAETFEVSRGTVREAIRMLIHDGLLIQNKSVLTLFNPTNKDIVDISVCRESLELLAIELSIQNITNEEIKKLEYTIEKSESLQKERKYEEIGKYDEEFHRIIVESTRNNQLIQLMDVIRSKVIYMMSFIVHENLYLPPLQHHKDILEALKRRDKEEAIKAMKIHLNYSLETLLENLGRVDE